ncbi:MAG: FAD-binding oxidoreductase [Alphaproteobacteria bacterium]|nr:FAD-binding oxidoreductase [Alphaproteobacteria bacterium]
MPPPQSDIANATTPALPRAPDLAIIGGGIVGLWCAVRAGAAGLRTVLLEKDRIGQGASGGFLGALMPHQPIRWTPEKAFQLDALMSLETEIVMLQERTGIDCGYRRCGRLIPTRTEKKRAQRIDWQAAARQNWPMASPGGTLLEWRLLDATPDAGWLAPDAAPLGCEFDTLSARVSPRALLAALAVAAGSTVDIRERSRVARLHDGGALIVLDDGTELTPGRIILTAGYETFDFLHALAGRRLGRGVKGQAALMHPRRPVDPDAPILYFGGVYVIAHDNGLIAIGSTSESEFADATATDHRLDDLVARAMTICPALDGAALQERWTGVRPNAIGRHPMIGPRPDCPRIVVCTGGYKISFGIAHRMADAALGFVTDQKTALPSRFEIAAHLACAQ